MKNSIKTVSSFYKSKNALMLASVASMIDLFNTDNIKILQSLGYEVDVAANFKEGSITSKDRVNEYKDELKQQGIGIYQVPIPRSVKRIGDIIKSYKMVKKLVDEKHYQIVHCHSPIGGVICRLACRKARRSGTKVIYTAHGFHFFEGASKAAWLIYYPVEKWCSKYTDILITINQEDFLHAKNMKAKQVEFVPGIGVHVDEIKNIVVDRKAIRSEFGFVDDDFVFMSTGQISVRKNHEVVIRALAMINDEQVKYLIVGFGEEEDRLKRLVVKLGLDNRVVFAGYRKNVKEILHAVDAFVFPSLQEGLPVALMEAMAVGLPIVASRIRGNVDLIENGNGSYLVDCHDIEGFAKAIGDIKNNNSFNNMHNQIMKFDSIYINEKMHEIYLSCVK